MPKQHLNYTSKPRSDFTWSNVKNKHEAKKLLRQVRHLNLNIVDQNGKTALQLVLEGESYDKDNVIKYLIHQGAEVAPGVDIFALVREHCHKLTTIFFLMEKFPSYDVNTRDSKGRTLLLAYGGNIDEVNKLLSLGADPNAASFDGDTPIGSMDDSEAIFKLLQVGADPLNYKECEKSVVANILNHCAQDRLFNFSPWFNLLEYVLNLPQIKENASGKKQELSVYMLDALFDFDMYFRHYFANFQTLLMCLYEVNNDIVHMKFEADLPKVKGHALTTTHMVGLLGYAMVSLMGYGDCNTYYSVFHSFVMNFLYSLYAEPNVKVEQNGTISPLTVFLLITSYHVHVDEDYFFDEDDEDVPELMQKKFELFNKLIENGCDVNSVSLQICDPILNELKHCLEISDALFISILTHNEQYVEALIPHWWGPPLSLLLLCRQREDIMFWMPFLIQYDAVPKGMALYNELYVHLREHDVMSDSFFGIRDEWQQYEERCRGPLSLQSICKYKVRKYFATKVSPGTTLATLLAAHLPPLLRHVAMNQKTT